jgi:hypothetical protein
MGFVEEAQQKIYANERQELRKLLLEQKHAEAPISAEKTPAAPAEAAAAANVPAASKPAEIGPALSAQSATPSAESTAPSASEPANPVAGESTNTAGSETAAAPAEDPLAAEVDAEMAKIPDEKLHDRWSQLAKTKLDVQLKEILKGLPDGEAKNQLDEVLSQPTYEQTWESLTDLKENLPDEDTKAKLSAITREKFIEGDENVTFILATDAGKKLQGRIMEIHKSAEVRGDEGNTVLIKVAIDKSQFRELRSGVVTPGAAVTAKVHCGRSSLGYAWLHEVISFIQSKIIFRYF